MYIFESPLSGHFLNSILGKRRKENVVFVEGEGQKLQFGKTVGKKFTMVKTKTSPKVEKYFYLSFLKTIT